MRELVSGYPLLTRGAMLLIAVLALCGLYLLAGRLANGRVALATCLCTALYPVFFSAALHAHPAMAVTALTVWGLFFYLPAKPAETSNETNAPSWPDEKRRLVSLLFFSLAALLKAGALLTPLALLVWELFCRAREGKSRHASKPVAGTKQSLTGTLLMLVPLCVLALWFAYASWQAGSVAGAAEHLSFDLTAKHLLQGFANRVWQVTGHMNLFLLTIGGVLAMWRPPLLDAGVERRRIAIPSQLVFAFVVAAHVLALSLTGGAFEAADMLPVIPLVILVWVSTLQRRVRLWPVAVGIVCAGFALALLLKQPY